MSEAFFGHAECRRINDAIWQRLSRSRDVTRRIHAQAGRLKNALYRFRRRFDIDFVIVENALTIPMHIPLGLAITEFLIETGLPAISHNHDFYWERSRYLVNAVQDMLDMAFPPSIPNLRHVTINSSAQNELAWRKGLPSTLVPNVIDYDNSDRYGLPPVSKVRAHIGIAEDDILVLQPTRVVPRKGIELAIMLVARLRDPRCKLVVTHEAGDEGDAYMQNLRDLAEDFSVDIRFVHTKIGRSDPRKPGRVRAPYSLWDVYPCADLVTYTSLYEGFGNAFLETVFSGSRSSSTAIRSGSKTLNRRVSRR